MNQSVRRWPIIARYHGEKLNDYVIESLARKLGYSTFLSSKRVIVSTGNDGSSIDARIKYVRRYAVVYAAEKGNSAKIVVSISRELINSSIYFF